MAILKIHKKKLNYSGNALNTWARKVHVARQHTSERERLTVIVNSAGCSRSNEWNKCKKKNNSFLQIAQNFWVDNSNGWDLMYYILLLWLAKTVQYSLLLSISKLTDRRLFNKHAKIILTITKAVLFSDTYI